MFDVKECGERLKKERGRMNQEICAEKLRISRAALSYYETGNRNMDIEILHRFCELFNISADYILGLSDSPSKDVNMQIATKTTKLSEDAIENILSLDDVSAYIQGEKCESIELIDMFLKSSFLKVFTMQLCQYKLLANKFVSKFIENPLLSESTESSNNEHFELNSYMAELQTIKDQVDLSKYKLSQTFDHIIREVYAPLYEKSSNIFSRLDYYLPDNKGEKKPKSEFEKIKKEYEKEML